MAGALTRSIGRTPSSGAVVSLAPLPTEWTSTRAAPNDSDAFFTIYRDGTMDVSGNGAEPTISYDWVTPKSSTVGDNYEVRVTGSPAPTGGSATNTWLALSSARNWFYGNYSGVASSVDGTLTIEIRPTSGATAASDTLTLHAVVA